MPLTIKSILEFPSLQEAVCVTDSLGFDNEVTGAIVMEALDIEEWGRPGLILLTSYFALEHVSNEQLSHFFENAKKVGIAGFVLKMDRLVRSIPEIFMENCIKYEFPLIQIAKKVPYEKIITDVLESIVNRNAYLLEHYYNIHQHFTKLMLSQPGVIQILENLEEIMNVSVSLYEKVENKIIGTNETYHDFILHEKRCLDQTQYINYTYYSYTLSYKNDPTGRTYNALAVSIPNLGFEEYEMIVHHLDQEPTDMDYLAIENAAIALQTELIKQHALRQKNRSRVNEMASDLLHGRLSNPEDIKDTVLDLGMNLNSTYRVSVFQVESEKDSNSPIRIRYADTLINHAKIEFNNLRYVIRQESIILIVPVDSESLAETKRKIGLVIQKTHADGAYKQVQTFATISDEAGINNLPDAYRQAFDTQRILQKFGERPSVSTYNDMGIYQIFVETGNLETIRRFIPDNIWLLKESNPELLDTLHTFIDVNQNYSEAAQILFVHPKTVRYRVDRLKDVYNIDFQNPEEILHYSIGIRLLKFIPENN